MPSPIVPVRLAGGREPVNKVISNARALQTDVGKVLQAAKMAKSPQEVIEELVADAQYGEYHSKVPRGYG